MVIPNIWPPSALSPMWTEAGPGGACVPAGNESPPRRLAISYPQDKQSFVTNCAIPDSAPLAITRGTKLNCIENCWHARLKVDDYPSTDGTCDFV